MIVSVQALIEAWENEADHVDDSTPGGAIQLATLHQCIEQLRQIGTRSAETEDRATARRIANEHIVVGEGGLPAWLAAERAIFDALRAVRAETAAEGRS